MTTKEQERKALEQIRKIVAGLGDCSYIGMALDGCLEMAQENIDNDWGCSMKERAESAERRVKMLEDDLRFARENAEIQAAESRKKIDELTAALNEASDRYNTIRRDMLKGDDLYDCRSLVEHKICELEETGHAAEQDIIFHADHPESSEFQNAVKIHRAAQKDVIYWQELRSRIETAYNNC